MDKRKSHKRNSSSEEGRKVLYRLLLLAVGVVYTLVFILDYLLQLHFTFFLLLSLFGFVILTLFYMWIKVSRSEESSDDFLEDENAAVKESVKDPMMTVRTSDGLVIDCNEELMRLFGATDKSEIIGTDLGQLMSKPWSNTQRKEFRSQLKAKGNAGAISSFVSLDGKVFQAMISVSRNDADPGILHARFFELSGVTDIHVPEPLKQNQSEEHQDLLDEGIVPMAMIGIDYRFVRANKPFCDLLGYDEHELKRMSVLDIFLPSDKDDEQKNLSGIFSGEISLLKNEKRVVRRNRDVIWVSGTSSLIRDSQGRPKFVMSFAENITQRKISEQKLLNRKNRLAELVNAGSSGIVSVDRHHTILYINDRLRELLFGLTGVLIEPGYNLLDILPAAHTDDYLQLHKKAFDSGEAQVQKKINVSGRDLFVEIIFSGMKNESGQVNSLTLFGRDVTEQKNAELAILKEKEEAQKATKAKSDFLATMSHEIRTPLNGVIGMGRLLGQTNLNPKQKEFVDSLLLSGEALLSVINDILDYSKIESEKMQLEYKPMSVRRCIEETFDLLAGRAIEKKLSLQFAIDSNVPTYIQGDLTRMRQVLMNLVGNAIKFTTAGSISIRVHASMLRDGKHQLHFEVEDTGIGIPSDKIGSLFQTFSQVDSGTAAKYEGTGLGLAICKNLVTMMGGKIWVVSEQGRGSNFQFTIITEQAKVPEVKKQFLSGSHKLVNSNVLIIADERTEAETYASYFKRWNMNPHIASSAKEAMSRINSEVTFQLVMIDAQILSRSPFDLAIEIRDSYSEEKVPLVLFNAESEEQIGYDYTSRLFAAVIPKNLDRSKVLDILISVFSVEVHIKKEHERGLGTLQEKIALEIPARILIAEDNLINQKLVQNIFEGLGYRPDIVSNGREALNKMRSNAYDVAFMDVQMPELDGLEATRMMLKSQEISPKPYVIAMTAFALEGDRQKCIDAGMNDYISKPFLIEEIVEKLRKWNASVPSTTSAKAETGDAPSKVLEEKTLGRLKEMAASADMDFFGEVLKMYVKQAREVIEAMINACREGKWKDMSDLAHKLKGSSLNVGASLVAETCKDIEIKGKNNQAMNCSETESKLKKEFEETVKALSGYYGKDLTED
ncbi:MAG: PAS domain S-box protein [Bacteroidetes bacterium]|nr:MAG: PAS domain S-box protein [Bacteroidota bacterium]REK06549.1 MAG: PAS domain S-box protein [Bacteroidota bacterium]REK33315.1 MAG: PAS domain S-box protein [Bacteroidota bacterium]REK49715.1 MAG: PAS domain S-box protein [Bacteroidota bacterium]